MTQDHIVQSTLQSKHCDTLEAGDKHLHNTKEDDCHLHDCRSTPSSRTLKVGDSVGFQNLAQALATWNSTAVYQCKTLKSKVFPGFCMSNAHANRQLDHEHHTTQLPGLPANLARGRSHQPTHWGPVWKYKCKAALTSSEFNMSHLSASDSVQWPVASLSPTPQCLARTACRGFNRVYAKSRVHDLVSSFLRPSNDAKSSHTLQTPYDSVGHRTPPLLLARTAFLQFQPVAAELVAHLIPDLPRLLRKLRHVAVRVISDERDELPPCKTSSFLKSIGGAGSFFMS